MLKVITERDKKVYHFLTESRLPFTISQIADMFYNQTGNHRSAYTIASRRINAMQKAGYIEKRGSSSFAGETLIYTVKPSKQLRHQLTLSKFIAHLMTNGFQVLHIDTEKTFENYGNYGIRCDGFLQVQYNKSKFFVVVEVNINTEFNPKYDYFTKDIIDGKIKLNHPIIFVNICDHKFDSSKFNYCKPLTIKTDMQNFSKFQYLFIK